MAGFPEDALEREGPEALVICRCEEVTAEEIEAAVREGYVTLDAVKRATRAGMGPCQGRTCSRLIRQLLARAAGCKPAELGPAAARPPLRPCRLSILAVAGETESGDTAPAPEEGIG